MHQKVAGSIPGQDTYIGYTFQSWLEYLGEATDQCFLTHRCLSSLPLPLSLKLINIPSGEDLKSGQDT